MSQKKGNLNFNITLISGNNVVLVESKGYEPEIFMPEIIRGRIFFQNVIQSRRCCVLKKRHSERETLRKKKSCVFTKSVQEMRACNRGPLAFSTPALQTKHHNSREEITQTRTSARFETLPMPELQRRAEPMRTILLNDTTNANANAVLKVHAHANLNMNSNNNSSVSDRLYAGKDEMEQKSNQDGQGNTGRPLIMHNSTVPTPYEVIKDTLAQIPSSVKVICLPRDCASNVDERMKHNQNNISNHSSDRMKTSGYRVTSPPTLLRRAFQPFNGLMSSREALSKKLAKGPTSPKWRKCITPVRTYSRRSLGNRSTICGSPKELYTSKAHSKFIPSETVPPRGTHKAEVKRRKLIIDSRISLSPRTFKNQIKNSDRIIQKRVRLQLPKNRTIYELVKPSAFDMLTQSNRSRCMSKKLQHQFLHSCLNKTSTNNSNYQLLCTNISPLEQDKQLDTIFRQYEEQMQQARKMNKIGSK